MLDLNFKTLISLNMRYLYYLNGFGNFYHGTNPGGKAKSVVYGGGDMETK
jgi:hypothetical protein